MIEIQIMPPHAFLKLRTRLWKDTQAANKVDKESKVTDFGLKSGTGFGKRIAPWHPYPFVLRSEKFWILYFGAACHSV